MDCQLHDYQAAYARPSAESHAWKRDADGNGVDLAEVVRRVKPTMLIGASTHERNRTFRRARAPGARWGGHGAARPLTDWWRKRFTVSARRGD